MMSLTDVGRLRSSTLCEEWRRQLLLGELNDAGLLQIRARIRSGEVDDAASGMHRLLLLDVVAEFMRRHNLTTWHLADENLAQLVNESLDGASCDDEPPGRAS